MGGSGFAQIRSDLFFLSVVGPMHRIPGPNVEREAGRGLPPPLKKERFK